MLIIDTNQAERLPYPRKYRQRDLCLGELVLAEILLRSEGARLRTLRRLKGYKVKLGIQPAQLLDDLAGLNALEIVSYKPFLDGDDRLTRALLKRIKRGPITPRFLRWAETVKKANLRFGEMLVERTKRVRGAFRAKKLGKATSMDDVLPLADGVDSFIGELVVSSAKNGGQRDLRETDENFYQAVMANPYLRHFYLGLLHYLISASRAWDEQTLNLDPLPNRDDWTDLSLLLYIRDKHDRLITADGQVRIRSTAIVPNVRVNTAAEI